MPTLTDLVYLGALTLGAPYLAWRSATNARFKAELRLGERLFGEQVPPEVRDYLSGKAQPIWVHAASVGEANAAKSFVDAVQARFPGHPWVVSTFTETGFERARKLYGPEHVFHYPADLSWRVASALRAIDPACVVLFELELWPNLLRMTRKRGIPTMVINGRITESAARGLKRGALILGKFWRDTPDLYCVQDDVYAARLSDLGVPDSHIRVAGTMKYDTVAESVDPARQADLRAWAGLAADTPLIVAGSTWPGEEGILLKAYRSLRESHPALRLLIAPRHTERGAAIADLVRAAGLKPAQRSASEPGSGLDMVPILDTIGELAVAFSLATVAFVGRSLGDGDSRGGQNMLEPAALGVPTVYGPHTENFREDAQRLADAGGALVVDGADALRDALGALLRDGDRRRRMAEAAREVIDENRGATQRHVEALAQLIPDLPAA